MLIDHMYAHDNYLEIIYYFGLGYKDIVGDYRAILIYTWTKKLIWNLDIQAWSSLFKNYDNKRNLSTKKIAYHT